MALFNRQNNRDIPPELRPYYDGPGQQTGGWGRWILRIIVAIVIIVLLALLVHWAWDKAHENTGTSQPTTSKSQPTKPKEQVQKPQPKKSSNGNQPATSNSSNQGQAQAPQTSKQPQPAQSNTEGTSASSGQATPSGLANTGPGDTLAVFVATVAGGTVLYQIGLRKRRSASSAE